MRQILASNNSHVCRSTVHELFVVNFVQLVDQLIPESQLECFSRHQSSIHSFDNPFWYFKTVLFLHLLDFCTRVQPVRTNGDLWELDDAFRFEDLELWS